MAEQLICNQQVVGSTPITSSILLGEFPSGQRGQTVNLLSLTSLVRIQLPPPNKKHCSSSAFLFGEGGCRRNTAATPPLCRIPPKAASCTLGAQISLFGCPLNFRKSESERQYPDETILFFLAFSSLTANTQLYRLPYLVYGFCKSYIA